MDDLDTMVLPHLKTQFESGRAIMFTGAGFSLAARNVAGENLPTGWQLAEKIWQLCFPSDPFDTATSLQDVYEAALTIDANGLEDLLTRELTVDPNSIEDWLARYFLLPWFRVYTLNIDNIADAVSSRFPVPRPVVEVSATGTGSRKKAPNAPVPPRP